MVPVIKIHSPLQLRFVDEEMGKIIEGRKLVVNVLVLKNFKEK